MGASRIVSLEDCTEFRQALQARPPRVVHATLALLLALVGTALLWAFFTKADLVVRAAGRVRPVDRPVKVYNAGRGEVLSAVLGGRVVEVRYREGSEVRHGEVLIRLDTERLDNDIARRRRTIQAGEEELAKIVSLEQLLSRQSEATRAKVGAELAQVRNEVKKAKDEQAVNVRLAQLELDGVQDEVSRMRHLLSQKAVAEADFIKARTRIQEAQEKLAKAKLPVEEGRVAVVRRALELAEKDSALKGEELTMKRGTKLAEVETARIELANLELERKQAVIRAPLDGVVTTKEVNVGDILEAGKPVVEIAEQKGYLFEVAVSNEDMGHLWVGLPARIKLDAYDFQKYGTLQGTVQFIAPDSEGPQGSRPSSYLVRIAVEGTEVGRGDLRGRVKLGMSGQADIVTSQENILSLFLRQIRQTFSVG
jgi:HlyD family secretion protein